MGHIFLLNGRQRSSCNANWYEHTRCPTWEIRDGKKKGTGEGIEGGRERNFKICKRVNFKTRFLCLNLG